MGVYQKGVPIEITDTFTVDGVETDPTTVVYSLLDPSGTTTTYTWPGAVEISHLATGEFLLSLSPPTLPGEYFYDVDATGAVVASRAGNFTILPDVSSAQDLDWAVIGPCLPWADSQDVWDCCGQPMTTIGEGSMETECPVDMTKFAMAASQLLYELSGHKFSGTCERTVRPCGTSTWCGFQVLSRGHIVGGDWGWNGAWWGNGSRPCGCEPLSRIRLSGYPVRDVVQVKLDGVPLLEDDNWRLDERRWLTRVADADGNAQVWPSCQRLDLNDTEDGTFSVTYRYGQDPPIAGQMAAAQLGCELYRSCGGGGGANCALPTGTTRVTRQGIVIEKLAFSRWAFSTQAAGNQPAGWHTGMPLVDAFLGAYAPTGPKRRPMVYSPALRYARSVGQ